MKSLRCRFYALLALLFFTLCTSAQTLRLYRVDNTHTLQSDARYAIVYRAVNQGDTTYHALSRNTYKKGLLTTSVQASESNLQLTNDTLLWQLVPHERGAYIGYSDNKFLTYSSERAIEYKGYNGAEQWYFEWLPTGMLNIKTKLSSFRLAPRQSNPTEAALLKSNSLQLEALLYKVANTIPVQPNITTIHEGQNVGLLSNITTQLITNTSAVSATAMQHDTWLTHDTTAVWRTTQVSQDLFALQHTKGTLVPTADLSLTLTPNYSEGAIWQLTDGCITYNQQGQNYVLATHISTPNTLALIPPSRIDSTTWQAVSLVGLTQPLTVQSTATHSTLLSGAYTASAWDNISWQAHHRYDITHVVFPKFFEQLPCPNAGKEALLLATPSQTSLLTAWSNVLVQEGEHYTPLRPITSTATVPWCWPQNTKTTSENSWTLTYLPTTDEGWHTGVLPFSADVSQLPFQFATLSMDGEKLRCIPTTTLRAGEAFIYQSLSVGSTLRITATDATWLTTPLHGLLTGCSDTLRITNDSPTTYLLNEAGTAFIKAAPESIVLPGRAYLRLTTANNLAPSLSIDDLISHITTLSTTCTPTTYYTLQGHHAGYYPDTATAMRKLPKGLYIHQGKLITIP